MLIKSHKLNKLTCDGTNRSAVQDNDFWNLVRDDIKNKRAKVLVIGREVFVPCTNESNLIGFGGHVFKVTQRGKSYNTMLFHLGTLPSIQEDILKPNCIIE